MAHVVRKGLSPLSLSKEEIDFKNFLPEVNALPRVKFSSHSQEWEVIGAQEEMGWEDADDHPEPETPRVSIVVFFCPLLAPALLKKFLTQEQFRALTYNVFFGKNGPVEGPSEMGGRFRFPLFSLMLTFEIADILRWRGVFEILEAENADFVGLQEVTPAFLQMLFENPFIRCSVLSHILHFFSDRFLPYEGKAISYRHYTPVRCGHMAAC